MPPQLALLICIIFILFLFWVDLKKNPRISYAIWIPFLWMFLAGSRYASQWLNLGAPLTSTDVYIEGSPLDRAVFLFLILAGLLILWRRRSVLIQIFSKNIWIWLFFIYCAISILWSDYPFVAFKRLIKLLGNVVMVLIILTEDRHFEAIGAILRRLAFLLLPLSVLFIKYYPHLGRGYHHNGKPMFTGVTGHKNALGQLCLLCGIYFSWNLLINRREWIKLGKKLHITIYLVILPMIIWLFYKANSATSLLCMLVALILFLVSSRPSVARVPQRILVIGIICIILLGSLEMFFNIKGTVITMLGRDPSLTTRVPIWNYLISLVRDPIFGVGYESFWLGDRQQIIKEQWGLSCNAHNGYLDIYLNIGLIGLFLLVCLFLSGLRKSPQHLVTDYPAAILKLCFIVVVALYNWTEATFYGVSNIWILLLLGTMDISSQQKSADYNILNTVCI